MFSRIISFDTIENSSIWSAQYFSKSQEKTPLSSFPTVCIRDVAEERKETVNPQDTPYAEYTYIGLENIESSTRTLFLPTIKKGVDIKSTSKIFRLGDVLYGRLRPNLNKVYLVDDRFPVGLCTTEIIVLVLKKDILSEYFAEILLSEEVKQKAESLTRGASLPRVQVEDFMRIRIPLPDMSVQREIVEFIQTHRKQWNHYRTLVNEVPQFIQNSLYSKLYEDKHLFPMPALSH